MPGYKPSESTTLIELLKIVNAPPRASLIFLLILATLAAGLAAWGLVRHGAPADRAYAGSIEWIGRKPGPMLDEHARRSETGRIAIPCLFGAYSDDYMQFQNQNLN